MIELPFQIKFDFDFRNFEKIDKDVILSQFQELLNISPIPKVNFKIDNEYTSEILEIIEEFSEYGIPFEANLILEKVSQNYILKFKDLSKIMPNFNIIINTNATKNLYDFVNSIKNLGFAKIILTPQEQLKKISSLDFDEIKAQFEIIRKDKSFKNIYLLPFMSDKEQENFYTNNEKNRKFLTCATPWLNPIIKANGDLYCCENCLLGSLKQHSFWELWNCTSINKYRNELIIKKNFDRCFLCHKFYEESFLVVENGQFDYKGQTFIFNSEINYVKSSPKVALTKANSVNSNKYMVDVFPIYSNEDIIELNLHEKILVLIE